MSSRKKLVFSAVSILFVLVIASTAPLNKSNGYGYSYSIRPGDTLFSLGNKFDVDWHLIALANGLEYPYFLNTGQSLTIPLQSTYVNYTVAPEDNLFKISQSFEVYWGSIANSNGIVRPYFIYPGEILAIPLIYGATTTLLKTVTSTSSIVSTSSVSQTSQTSISKTYTTTLISVVTSTSVITASAYVTSSDPLATGNALYDNYDSIVLAAASEYGLDPMVLKSQIALESYFNPQAVSPDDPCGQVKQGGSDVGHSYGLLQMTPACISWFARNPDDSIDLATSKYSTQWGNSAFNPVYTIYSAALMWYENLQQAEKVFPGCTQTQYIDIGLSAYNAGFGSVYSCSLYNAQGTRYVSSVMSWYSNFSTASGWTDPY